MKLFAHELQGASHFLEIAHTFLIQFLAAFVLVFYHLKILERKIISFAELEASVLYLPVFGWKHAK